MGGGGGGVGVCGVVVFFLMIRRPPRSTLDRSSAATDVYKRQVFQCFISFIEELQGICFFNQRTGEQVVDIIIFGTVSYTHLRAHETVLDLVCRLLLEKKKPI